MITSDKSEVVPGIVVISSAQDVRLFSWSLFGYCLLVAISIMAAIPYGAFAACKAMKKQPEVSASEQAPKFTQRKAIEYPVKYNEALMNSIWGNYNRLSPHNIKKSCDAILQFKYGKDQQRGQLKNN